MGIFSKIFHERRKIGLALGSGGARGIAHIGVLQALDEFEFKVIAIAGTSAGAVVGAMFAYEPDWQTVARKMSEFFESHTEWREQFSRFNKPSKENRSKLSNLKEGVSKFIMWTRLANEMSILNDELLREFVDSLLPDKDIEECEIPFAVAAYDLVSAREIVITNGSVRDAVIASSSIPGIFPPVERDGMLLVDGGGICPVPVEPVRQLGAKKIFAVDVSPSEAKPFAVDSGLATLFRVIDGESQKIKESEMQGADKIIIPLIKAIGWWQFEYYKEIANRGYEAAVEVIGHR